MRSLLHRRRPPPVVLGSKLVLTGPSTSCLHRRRPPPVVLSDDLVRDPEGMLRALCAALELPFDPAVRRGGGKGGHGRRAPARSTGQRGPGRSEIPFRCRPCFVLFPYVPVPSRSFFVPTRPAPPADAELAGGLKAVRWRVGALVV